MTSNSDMLSQSQFDGRMVKIDDKYKTFKKSHIDLQKFCDDNFKMTKSNFEAMSVKFEKLKE